MRSVNTIIIVPLVFDQFLLINTWVWVESKKCIELSRHMNWVYHVTLEIEQYSNAWACEHDKNEVIYSATTEW